MMKTKILYTEDRKHSLEIPDPLPKREKFPIVLDNMFRDLTPIYDLSGTDALWFTNPISGHRIYWYIAKDLITYEKPKYKTKSGQYGYEKVKIL